MKEINMYLDMLINTKIDIEYFKNFSIEELNKGVEYLHKRHKPYKSQITEYNSAEKHKKPLKFAEYLNIKKGKKRIGYCINAIHELKGLKINNITKI